MKFITGHGFQMKDLLCPSSYSCLQYAELDIKITIRKNYSKLKIKLFSLACMSQTVMLRCKMIRMLL